MDAFVILTGVFEGHGIWILFTLCTKLWGYAITHLIVGLCYKSEGCGFDSQWGL